MKNQLSEDEKLKLQKLQELLLDLDNIEDQLKDYLKGFNVFDTLKVSRTEIRHSNVLAWLFDPRETHGLGGAFIQSFINVIISKGIINNNIDKVKLLLTQFDNYRLFREKNNIDILAVNDSEQAKVVLVIENKIDSNDHNDQLNRYYEYIESEYDEYERIYLYLTPDGRDPLEESGNWDLVGYDSIIDAISRTTKKATINQHLQQFIDDYLDILRREIVDNNELNEICTEIYNKHKEALDLIFENKPDRLQNVADIIVKWCEKKENEEKDIFIFNKEKSNKFSTKFTTSNMNEYVPREGNKGGWNTQDHYFYEIISYTNKNGAINYRIALTFSLEGADTKMLNTMEDVDRYIGNSKGKKGDLKDGRKWRTVYSTSSKSVEEYADLPDIGDEKNDIYKNLNEMYNKIREKEERLKIKMPLTSEDE